MEKKNVNKQHIPPIVNYAAKDIKLHVYSGLTYFGVMKESESSRNTIKQMHDCEFNINTYYINNTSLDINVGIRNGLILTIPSNVNLLTPVFIIRSVLTFKCSALKSVIRYLGSLNNIKLEELNHVKDKLSNLSTYSEAQIMIDYIIPLEDVKILPEETLYHYQTDSIVSTKMLLDTPLHPYMGTDGNMTYVGNITALNNVNSSTISKTGLINEYTYNNLDSMHMRIRYVDHSPTASVKFINMFGKVFCLFPERTQAGKVSYKGKTADLMNYVEIVYTSKNDFTNNSKKPGATVIRYTLEEAHKLIGLYVTYTDAEVNGNPEARRKIELANTEHEINVLKNGLLRDKTLNDIEASNREAVLNKEEIKLQELKNAAMEMKALNDIELAKLESSQRELRIQQAKLDADLRQLENEKAIIAMRAKIQDEEINRENAVFKNKLDRNLQNRRDISDAFKFIPGIIIAVGGIATLLVKNSKN